MHESFLQRLFSIFDDPTTFLSLQLIEEEKCGKNNDHLYYLLFQAFLTIFTAVVVNFYSKKSPRATIRISILIAKPRSNSTTINPQTTVRLVTILRAVTDAENIVQNKPVDIQLWAVLKRLDP